MWCKTSLGKESKFLKFLNTYCHRWHVKSVHYLELLTSPPQAIALSLADNHYLYVTQFTKSYSSSSSIKSSSKSDMASIQLHEYHVRTNFLLKNPPPDFLIKRLGLVHHSTVKLILRWYIK